MKPEETSKNSGIKKYLSQGIMSFLVIAASVIFFFLLFRMETIRKFFKKIFGILGPVIMGLVVSYLLNPIVNYLENLFYEHLLPKSKQNRKPIKAVRYICIFISFTLVCLTFYILGILIFPQLYTTILGIAREMPAKIDEVTYWFETHEISNPIIADYVNKGIETAGEYLEKWVKGDLLRQLNTWATYFATGILNFITVIKNLAIGFIISVYVLSSKEKFCAQGKMIIYAIFRPHISNEIIDIFRQSNKIFSGFIVGKLIDSTIIGILCFIGLSILNMPYTLLVSVIVGVTNIIPFFGPYIGAIPSALLILVASPIHALYFIIFILVLQQLDGNIIGPKILGDSTGLSAFWVVFSILLGGGLFGLLGMLIGVPTFAVIYYIIKRGVTFLLQRKNLKCESSDYVNLDCIQMNDTGAVYVPLESFPDTEASANTTKSETKEASANTTKSETNEASRTKNSNDIEEQNNSKSK